MSRLETLIQELCPDGVKYVSISNVCNISKGVQYNKRDMKETGSYPVINGGVEPSGYIEKYNQNANTITISQGGASAGYVNWISSKFWAGAHCYILQPSEKILNRYLYHYIKSKEYKLQECQYGAGIPALAKSTIEQIYIPVPPLEIQSEIVRILDNFTELTAELIAELTARKQQYEYYRDFLLENSPSDSLYIELGMIAKIGDGLHGTPHYNSDGGYYFVNGNNIQNGKIVLTKDTKQVDLESYNKYQIGFDNNTVFMSINGTIGNVGVYGGEPIILGKSIAYFNANPEKLYPRYLFYYLQSSESKKYFAANVTGGTVKNLGLQALRKYRILLPDINYQKRIAFKLDNFDTICSDLRIGIPAEIEVRNKQYEYYRDKLLTFKEKIA